MHRRVGDGRLLRVLSNFSVGEATTALEGLCRDRCSVSASARRLSDELAERGAGVVTILDAEYPGCLRALEKEAPPLLYVLGDVGRLKARSIAVIGTRNPSAIGRA